MDIGENLIRTCAANQNLGISPHAQQRMKERCISIYQIYDCVARGAIIESQDLERDLKLLFQEYIHEGEPSFYVVVACRVPPLVVSVIPFDKTKWEFKNGRMRRR